MSVSNAYDVQIIPVKRDDASKKPFIIARWIFEASINGDASGGSVTLGGYIPKAGTYLAGIRMLWDIQALSFRFDGSPTYTYLQINTGERTRQSNNQNLTFYLPNGGSGYGTNNFCKVKFAGGSGYPTFQVVMDGNAAGKVLYLSLIGLLYDETLLP